MAENILFLAGFAFIFAFLILSVRGPRPVSQKTKPQLVTDIVIDTAQAAQHLSAAIQYQTISHQDPAQVDQASFAHLHAFLEQAFPLAHRTLHKEVVEEHSLLYTWRGQQSDLKPILLTGHLDVVPIEPGTEQNWSHPPFAGRIAEGYIWGRGAMDDKMAVLSILEAVEHLLQTGFQPQRTVYLAFGHDEEVGGQGAKAIAGLLDKRGIQVEFVLDEGLAITEAIMPSVSQPVALVGIAEKGYVSIELVADGQGGHSATPPAHTAIGTLSTAIHRLEQNPPPARLADPGRQMLQCLAPHMPVGLRLIIGNLWLSGGLLKRQLAASPETNAMIRTTTAATIFQAGVKENVLPTQAKAVVNARILPGDTIPDVIDHVRRVVDGLPIQVRALEDSQNDDLPISDTDTASFALLEETIRQIFPQVIVAPGLVIGMTDCRRYAKLSRNLYRFSPLWVTPQDMSRIHGTDERIAVEHYGKAIQFFVQLIRNTKALTA